MKAYPLRWAIIQVGPVSSGFAGALERVEKQGHQRYAIVSADLAEARKFAEHHKFKHALPLDSKIFDHPEIDIFYIGLPVESQRDLCIAAIRAGKPFLCEKPMTGNLHDFRAVQAALAEQPVFAMEAMWLKFNPLIQELKRSLISGQVGEVLSANVQIGYQDASDGRVVEAHADALTVFGCYAMALALEFFGAPQAVFARGQEAPTGTGVAQATVLLDYPSHLFTIECSVATTLANSLRISGSAGYLSIPSSVIDPYRIEKGVVHLRSWTDRMRSRLGPVLGVLVDILAFLHPLHGAGLRGEIEDAGRHHARGDKQSLLHPLSQTEEVHQMIDAARRSMRERNWQALIYSHEPHGAHTS